MNQGLTLTLSYARKRESPSPDRGHAEVPFWCDSGEATRVCSFVMLRAARLSADRPRHRRERVRHRACSCALRDPRRAAHSGEGGAARRAVVLSRTTRLCICPFDGHEDGGVGLRPGVEGQGRGMRRTRGFSVGSVWSSPRECCWQPVRPPPPPPPPPPSGPDLIATDIAWPRSLERRGAHSHSP